tara:strand:- start:53 stop:592 length:540 start_codon:yes stop_codon:yes gene_type:complete
MVQNTNYKNKYLKYKLKYEKIYNQKGGMETNDDVEITQTLTREEAQVISLLIDDDEFIKECMIKHHVIRMDKDTWNNLLNETDRWRSYGYDDDSKNMPIPNWILNKPVIYNKDIDKPVIDIPENLFYKINNNGMFWYILDPIANIIYEYRARDLIYFEKNKFNYYLPSLKEFHRECIIR